MDGEFVLGPEASVSQMVDSSVRIVRKTIDNDTFVVMRAAWRWTEFKQPRSSGGIAKSARAGTKMRR
jgi:hypothetical protein